MEAQLNSEPAKLDSTGSGDSKRDQTPKVRTDVAKYCNKGMTLADLLAYFEVNPNATHEEAGKALGMSRGGVSNFLWRHKVKRGATATFRKQRAAVFTIKQQQLLEAITPAKIKEAPLASLVGSAKTLYELERLETGQSTANVGIASYDSSLADLEAEERLLLADLGGSERDNTEEVEGTDNKEVPQDDEVKRIEEPPLTHSLAGGESPSGDLSKDHYRNPSSMAYDMDPVMDEDGVGQSEVGPDPGKELARLRTGHGDTKE